ncbi:MAG: DUF4214 domain-containing protein [Clostridia bacterium]|nr:DUF4214 domain-containing protein [Clostridia bacterium]
MRINYLSKRVLSVFLAIALFIGPLTLNSSAAANSGVNDFVSRCYYIALGRSPDYAGLTGWTNKLESGEACGVSITYGFVNSPEFQNAGFTNSEYVEKMYNMLLGRSSDVAGKASWVTQLDAGRSKEDIFSGFANSEEFFNLCASYGIYSGYYISGSGMERNAAINGFVDRLYSICFGRHGDISGQGGWVMNLANGSVDGSSAAYGFIFSPEYMNKKASNVEYVKMLYSTFLGRTADEAGLNSWVSKLDYGELSREAVFNGFANSAEFSNICTQYGIERGNADYADKTYTAIYSVTPTPEITVQPTPPSTPVSPYGPTSPTGAANERQYIANINTYKIHIPGGCSRQPKPENQVIVYITDEDLHTYDLCSYCF